MRRYLKFILPAFLVFLSVGITGLFFLKAVVREKAAARLTKAEDLRNQGKLDDAVNTLVPVLAEDPSHEPALRLLADITEKKQNFHTAAMIFRQLTDLNPQDEELPRSYAYALNASLDYETARLFLNRLRLRRELSALETLELIRAEIGVGRLAEAQEHFRALRGIDAGTDAVLMELVRGDLIARSGGSMDKAEEIYKKLENAKAPPEIKCLILLRIALLMPDEKKEPYLREAAILFPEQGALMLAEYYVRNRRFEESAKVLENLPHRSRSMLSVALLGETYAALKNADKIALLADEVPSHDRKGTSLRNYLAALEAFLREDWEKTLRMLSAGGRDFAPAQLEAYLCLAARVKMHADAQDIILEAKRLLEAAPDRKGEVFTILKNAAESELNAGKKDEAVRLAEYLSKIASGSDDSERFLLHCFRRTGKNDFKVSLLAEKILKKNPSDPEALRAEIETSPPNRSDKELSDLLKRLLTSVPDSEFAMLGLARIAEKNGNENEARQLLEKLLPMQPGSLSAADEYFGFLLRHDRAKAPDFAQKLSEDGSRKPEMQGRAFFYKGLLALGAGKDDDARKFFLKSIELCPNQPEAYLYLADFAKDDGEREFYLSSGADANLRNPPLLMQLASFYARQGKDEKAALWYERLKDIAPNNAAVFVNYAEVLAALDRKREALDCALKARRIAPRDPRVRECLAMRELDLDNFSDALPDLEDLLKSNPEEKRIRNNLINGLKRQAAFFQKIRQPGAEKIYQRITELEEGK